MKDIIIDIAGTPEFSRTRRILIPDRPSVAFDLDGEPDPDVAFGVTFKAAVAEATEVAVGHHRELLAARDKAEKRRAELAAARGLFFPARRAKR